MTELENLKPEIRNPDNYFRVRTYVTAEDGELEPLDDLPSSFQSVVPNVGDTISTRLGDAWHSYEVVSRHCFVLQGWALVLRDTGSTKLNQIIAAWEADEELSIRLGIERDAAAETDSHS